MVSIVGNNRDLGFDACNLFPLKNSVISVLNFSGSVPDISIVFFFFFSGAAAFFSFWGERMWLIYSPRAPGGSFFPCFQNGNW